MIYKLADNVITPLGMTTAENYQAVKHGGTRLRRYDTIGGLTLEPFTAALFTEEQNQELRIAGLTRFESLAVRSIQAALSQTTLRAGDPNVGFILSTTKANIELLPTGTDAGPAAAAQRIAARIGFANPPIVVCNACISGVSAIALAQRLLETGRLKYAVVCGADVQNTFTISGFQSLKAVAAGDCRPFDIERTGLNLGEAAATIILQQEPLAHQWAVMHSATRNDGWHITAPARNGEGLLNALTAIDAASWQNQLAFINAHGTATLFNDQMESVAIERAGLQHVRVNAYKGYFGHTLGAAGILETVLSMAALDDHTILGTRGFQETGVSGSIQLTAENKSTDKQLFVKMISGFGGCNGALLLGKDVEHEPMHTTSAKMEIRHRVVVTPRTVSVDGAAIKTQSTGKEMLTELYKQYMDDYPKFYKMDAMCRLGLVTAELLSKAENHATDRTAERSIILFNHSSSEATDRQYQQLIVRQEDFFPSPSVFIYTLPNMVAGEIAIRHQYKGETSFYILPEHDETLMAEVMEATSADAATTDILGGWIDYEDENHFEADFFIATRR